MNAYLTYLTDGEPNLDWFWTLVRRCLYLWIGSSILIQNPASTQMFFVFDATDVVGLPLCIAIIILLLGFVVVATRLTLSEIQKEQFSLLRLTNITSDKIFWFLVLGIIYRARRWLIWIIGGWPFFIWIISLWYMGLIPGPSGNLPCFLSLLRHSYCYGDAPEYPSKLLEVVWFLSMTISILGITAFALISSVGFTLKNRDRGSHIMSILLVVVPFVLAIVLLIAPEGFLWIETKLWNLIIGQVFLIGIIVAALPCIAAFGVQRFLRRWALD